MVQAWLRAVEAYGPDGSGTAVGVRSDTPVSGCGFLRRLAGDAPGHGLPGQGRTPGSGIRDWRLRSHRTAPWGRGHDHRMTCEDRVLRAVLRTAIVHEPFVSHSGLELPWKWELERLGVPGLKLVSAALTEVCQQGAIAGIDRGGWTLSVHMNRRPKVLVQNGDLVFADPKSHWRQPVTLIDDVRTTGHSLRAAEMVLNDYGIEVIEHLVVFDRCAEVGAIVSPSHVCSLVASAELREGGSGTVNVTTVGRLREWRCCLRLWQLILSPRYPWRSQWNPVCECWCH